MASSMSSLESLNDFMKISVPERMEVKFKKKLKTWECTLCKDIAYNSWQLACGHRICGKHLESFPKEGLHCDLCDITIEKEDQVIPDIAGRKEIRSATVFCINERSGCKETMELKNLEVHLENCPFSLKPCDNVDKGCKDMLLDKDRSDHLKVHCQYEPTSCKYCKELITRSELKEHVDETCPRVLVHCRYKCDNKTTMLRSEMIEHEKQCPKRRRRCTFYEAGCLFENISSEVDEHEHTNMTLHMTLMSTKTREIDDAIKEVAALKSLNEVREKQLRSIHQEKGEKEQLRSDLQSNKKQIQELKLLLATQGEKYITLTRKTEDLASRGMIEKLKTENNKLKEEIQQLLKKLSLLERSPPTEGNGSRNGLDAEATCRFEQQLALYDTKLSELDLRFQLLETASFDGQLMWKIRDYSRRKREAANGKTLSLFSQPFYSSRNGYKMCGRVYLNGDGVGKGSYLSFFFVIMRGDFDALLHWPFKPKISLVLLSQDGITQNICDTFAPDPTSNSFRKPQSEMNVASGIPKFVSHQRLETSPFLQDDIIYLMIKIDRTGSSDI